MLPSLVLELLYLPYFACNRFSSSLNPGCLYFSVQRFNPRYGHTEELARMVDIVKERYPTSPKVMVGFSMGGNVVSKYLGEVRNLSRD